MQGIPPNSEEGVLRAMARNYAGGHRWDHLDGEVAVRAADEIKSLRLTIERLTQHQERSFSTSTERRIYDQFMNASITTNSVTNAFHNGRRGVMEPPKSGAEHAAWLAGKDSTALNPEPSASDIDPDDDVLTVAMDQGMRSWWAEALFALWAGDPMTLDTRRAAKVACNLIEMLSRDTTAVMGLDHLKSALEYRGIDTASGPVASVLSVLDYYRSNLGPVPKSITGE